MADSLNQSKNPSQSKGVAQRPVSKKWPEADSARADVQETFGLAPTFMRNFTDHALVGAWQEAKVLRFGTDTAIEPRIKGLMAYAIAVQIPCPHIGYFEQKATLGDGATRQEQLEAVLMSAITRHWSAVLNGFQQDKKEFKAEADKIFAYVKKMMLESGGKLPPEEAFLFKPTNAEDALKDIEKTLGFVPTFFKAFSKEALAGAWSEFKGLQLNPYTALDGKQKELIGLAVAAQIPCDYCVYFHKNAALLNGASEREIAEAIVVAGMTRHWSSLFHGPDIDMDSFKRDADQMLEGSQKRRLQ